MRLSPSRWLQILVLAMGFAGGTELAAAQDAEAPLPDIPTLMHQVESHQKQSETIQKDYIYHTVEIQQERDGGGAVKKRATREYDVFWISGVPVRKLTRKDGRELTAEEQAKESEHIDKQVAKAKERKDKGDAKGKETGPRGDDMISASRILELGSFSNARRVQLDERDTIVVDYAGDPKAKTHNRFEDVVRDLVGTIWIDEQDKVIRKTEGHFLNAFKIGAGLVVNIRKDTSFGMEQKKVNGEVWLPAHIEGQGAARALLLFSFNGSVDVRMSDYRKFKATSTVLPGVSTVEENSNSPAAPVPPAPVPPTPVPQTPVPQ